MSGSLARLGSDCSLFASRSLAARQAISETTKSPTFSDTWWEFALKAAANSPKSFSFRLGMSFKGAVLIESAYRETISSRIGANPAGSSWAI